MKKYILSLIVLTLPVVSLFAQKRVGETRVRYSDISAYVASKGRFTYEHPKHNAGFLSASRGKEYLYLVYNTTPIGTDSDIDTSLVITRRFFRKKITADTLSAVMPSSCAQSIGEVSVVGNPPRKKIDTEALLFNMKDKMAVSVNSGNNWSSFHEVNGSIAKRVCGMYRTTKGALVALYTAEGSFTLSGDSSRRSMIFKIHSYDNGYSWSNPEVAVKHNMYPLDGASLAIVNQGKANHKMYLLTYSNQTERAYLSASTDDGENWSYPMPLSSILNGYNHRITVNKGNVYILYYAGENMGDDESSVPGDLLLWNSSLRNFEHGYRGDMVVRLLDIDKTLVSKGVDLGMEIIAIGKKKLFCTVNSYWVPGEPSKIKSFIIKPEKLKVK